MANEKIFVGLDIGTNSVGYAVTDDTYKLRKFKNNLMWGVHLFDEAKQSAERRAFRTARRRLDRRKQRIALLQEFFAHEILKVDKSFFFRLKESGLLPEDSEYRTRNILFDDEGFGDKEYYERYPTIHHLICELMSNRIKHDVRLVYLACAYILSHRGHFLFDVDKNNLDEIKEFPPLYNAFFCALSDICDEVTFDIDCEKLSEILRSHISVTEKSRRLTEFWFGGKKPNKDLSPELRFDCLIKLVSGGPVKLSDMFNNEEYKELEKNSVSITAADFDETLDKLYGTLSEKQWALLDSAKKMNDWALLVNSLGEYSSVSEAKVAIYEEHKNDLKELKEICRKYLTVKQNNEIFKDADGKPNYAAYIYNSKDRVEKYKKCIDQDEFCKFVKKYLETIKCEAADEQKLSRLIEKCNSGNLCPKQVTTDNRVIPYQLYYAELKTILKNASEYLPFLNEADKYGTVSEKILSIMEFRIPYYVGPLVSSKKSNFAWLERKAEGKIYPWNYKELIDLDKTEEAFIRRMTCKCTYLAGEDVLPKNSLLYCKFNVLNEINNLTVDGNKISVSAKQTIYNELFLKKQKVTRKDIEGCLKTLGELKDGQLIGGIDTTIKSSLKTYFDFERLLSSRQLTEADVERIIERITVTTDISRLKKFLKDNYPQLSSDDISYISKLKYNDYGRLSRTLLEEVYEVDNDYGEVISDKNIIAALWNTNDNLMQLLGSKYRYKNAVEAFNANFYSDPNNSMTAAERMNEMYIPTAVRRSVTRTLDIVKELKSVIGHDPDKIFIEMAREVEEGSKGKRTISRREQIKALYAAAKEIADKERMHELEAQLESTDDGRLRSEKYYLYFIQLGRCMYTGHSIDFDKLGSDTYYNIDHIWPQAKVKDDSLENKVLVESTVNGEKGDSYPLSADIRNKMHSFWLGLKNKSLMGEKKYQRLTRSSSFSEDELAGFIARQLVETRQSTKAAAQLIKELCPNSKIVYVKAGLASEFRQEMDMLKCREINDLHHAKDAYLNIIVGNVYNTQFTDDPFNFIRSGQRYSVKMLKKSADGKCSGLMAHTVKRGNNLAWDPDTSFAMVRKMMSKNSIRYVKYSYCRKGGFFNQQPERKKAGLVERKAGLDTAKYGGYNDTAASFFSLVKYDKSIVFIPIELMYWGRISADSEFAKEYASKQLSQILSLDIDPNKVVFPLANRVIKIHTMLDIDGFRCNIVQKMNKGRTMVLSSANSLVLDDVYYSYAKKVTSFVAKYKQDKSVTVQNYMGIEPQKNIELFDILAQKAVTKPYNVMLEKIGTKITAGRDEFTKLPLTEQTILLSNLIYVLKTGRSTGCDLKLIGESGQAGVITLNSNIAKASGKKSIVLIDQSPTGLFEKRSKNLLEL